MNGKNNQYKLKEISDKVLTLAEINLPRDKINGIKPILEILVGDASRTIISDVFNWVATYCRVNKIDSLTEEEISKMKTFYLEGKDPEKCLEDTEDIMFIVHEEETKK